MATNYGLLTNAAAGVREALAAYQTRKSLEQKERQLELLHGTPEEAARRRELQMGLLEAQIQKAQAAPEQEAMDREAKRGLIQAQTRLYDTKAAGEKASAAAGPSSGFSKAFEGARAKALGKSAAEWATKDRAVIASNLEKVDSALDELENAIKSGQPLFGPGRGHMPDKIRAFTNPKALDVRDRVHSAITDTLRPTLGAQFTEKEGKRIMDLQLRDTLSDADNLRRIQALRDVMRRKIEATDAMYSWIEKRGSLDGFPLEKYGMERVKGDSGGGSGGAGGLIGGDSEEIKVINGQKFKKVKGGWQRLK